MSVNISPSPGMAQSSPLLSLDTLHRARATVASSSLGVRHTPCLQVLYCTVLYCTPPASRCCTVPYCTVLYTPCLQVRGRPGDTCCPLLPALPACWERAWLKCENFQNTGSFKLRGVAAQFAALDTEAAAAGLVTMSAGNYGRSFSVAAQQLGLAATVCMPDTAPDSREAVMRGRGAEVERMPSSGLEAGVRRHRDQGKVFLHPSDDLSLIAGHASLGLEILEDVPEVDVVVVCCGGGGLLAGVAAAIKVTRHQGPAHCHAHPRS